MGYGRGPIPKGTLPVFSVDTIHEAKDLLVLACPLNNEGKYVAPELAIDQTIENLAMFGKRLELYYSFMKATPDEREAIRHEIQVMEVDRIRQSSTVLAEAIKTKPKTAEKAKVLTKKRCRSKKR